uniref:Cystatin domain-containing protein n=1 Tax=Panagrolaimus sp. JU765 TaxID=591449 RepID=A0AC34QDR5_9BILA
MLKFYFLLILAVIGSAKLVGEPSDLSEEVHESSDSQFYSYLADEALRRINFESADSHHWKLDKILKTSGQIVNGVKYELNFIAIKTECNKQVGSKLGFYLGIQKLVKSFWEAFVAAEQVLPT